jgi:hypothetical protein
MIPARTAGRAGGPGVPTHASSRPAIRPRAAAALLVTLVVTTAAAMTACGPSGPTTPPLGRSASPAGSGGVALPTAWPGNAVLGIEALGVADGQISAATADLMRGIANEDLALMRKAADGLAGTDVLLPNMAKIRLNPAMVSFADRYEAAIIAISGSGKKLRDAIDAGDAAAIPSATQDLLNGLKMYTAITPELAAWVEQMPEQKRMLTQ